MKTIAFLNNKGGVGKTSTVINVGFNMSKVHEKKILCVDIDPQGSLSNFYRKYGYKDYLIDRDEEEDSRELPLSLGDLLLDTSLEPGDVIRNTSYENIDILESYPTLEMIEKDLEKEIRVPQQYKLQTQLKKVSGQYDYCLIDCGPSLSLLNVNALISADEVYIPTLIDNASLVGVEMTKNELIEPIRDYTPSLQLGGIITTRYKKNTKITKQTRAILDNYYDDILPMWIAESVKVYESSHEYKPLLDLDNGKNKSAVTLDYLNLASYIVAPNKKLFLEKFLKEQGDRYEKI